MNRLFTAFAIGALVSSSLFIAALAHGASVYEKGSSIFFDNQYIRYEVGQNGLTRSLVRKTSGVDYLDRSVPQHFMHVKKSGREYGSSNVTLNDNLLVVEFGGSGVSGVVRVTAWNDCFIFELVDVQGQGVEAFGMARLFTTISEHIGQWLNIAYNDEFGICLLGLNLQTHSEPARSNNETALCVSCIQRFGLVGSRFALIGLPMSEMLSVIGKLELEFGLPHPLIDGEWDKVSRAVETSYLFLDGNQTNIDSCIKYAKAGGFKYLVLSGGIFSSYGHYDLNLKMFPDGLSGLKSTMDKIHKAGLKGGIHFLVGWVSKHDPYVTPVPDKRLAKDGKFILARDITAHEDLIPITQSPKGYPTEAAPVGRGGCELQIGDELISYSGLSTSPPYGFTGCKRGIHGTKAFLHTKNATVYHMMEAWGRYLVGADTDMLEEMASRMGRIINECGIDMIFFDGGETMDSLGPGWYYIPKVKEAYYRHIKREVLYQGSGIRSYAWHIYSRGYCNDYVVRAVKRFLDRHKVPARMQIYHDNMLQADFGWWGYILNHPSAEATLPDEIEYGYSKGAGFDTPMGLQTSLRGLMGNGRTDEVMALAKRWEELRLSGVLSEKTKKELRILGQEYTSRPGGLGNWNLHRISYGPDHYVKSIIPSSAQWQYRNVYLEQPLRVRIRAKHHYAEYGNSKNTVMTDFGKFSAFKSKVSSPDLAIQLSVSTEKVRTGSKSWKIIGTNRSDRRSSWAQLQYRQKECWDLSSRRGLGVWVWGDGSGALLNISISDPPGVHTRNHYVDLDFKGWKYCQLSEPEGDRLYEYRWPFSIKRATMRFNYRCVMRVSFFLNEIPANTTVTCYLSPVEALADKPTLLHHPTLTINGDSVTFPVTLHDDEYLEYWGGGPGKVYDPNNLLLQEIRPEGVATMGRGENKVSFGCKSEDDKFRAKITIITLGEALNF